MKRAFVSLGLLFLIPLWAICGQPSSQVSLQVLCEPLPPMSYEQDGVARGLATEVVQAVLGMARYRANIQVMPWNRAYQKLQSEPRVILYPIAQTAARLKTQKFHWIGPITPPIYSSFLALKSSKIRLLSIEDAKRYKVGCVIDDYNQDFLLDAVKFNPSQLSYYDTQEKLIQKLYAGEVDLIFIPQVTASAIIEGLRKDENLIENCMLVQRQTMVYYMAISQDTPPEVVQDIRDAFEKIRANGMYDSILKNAIPR